jgi:hypothetical protein
MTYVFLLVLGILYLLYLRDERRRRRERERKVVNMRQWLDEHRIDPGRDSDAG